ncbi:MAG: hypothetical protein ACWA6U_16290 [Breznakibacter sp.]
MKQIIALVVLVNFFFTGFSQDFKYIKPKLTDSTKVVKTEIDTKNQFERIYYIDYAINSQAKKEIINFGLANTKTSKSIGSTYLGVLKNLKNKPKKINSNLPERWVKVFKYQGDWILFNDLPKYLLTDTCLVTFQMDDPVSSVIVDYKSAINKYDYCLLLYNWENPTINQKSDLQIKIIDSKRLIALWRFEYQGQITYDLMIPIDQVSHYPVMVMMETDLMDDENEIFDKIDYEKLWNE